MPREWRNSGKFVVSLDFELHWGVRDLVTLEDYRENLLGVRRVVPALLELFGRYEIHATWATVGFLFFDTREQLLAALPERRPQYVNAALSPYPLMASVGANEAEDPIHFAGSLVRLIAVAPHQEIATHTFSHYYCLEKGQTIADFRADLEAARSAAARLGLRLESLVFPRNQFNAEYLEVCRELGLRAYRGNEATWLYRARSHQQESGWRRALRLVNAYVPISGNNSWRIEASGGAPVNVPSSRFLRPYSATLGWLEPLRLRRVTAEMTHAAQNGLGYHLWWHPHNFGRHIAENLAALEKILKHFERLRNEYGMESLNMGEAADRVLASEESQVTHAG